MNKDTIRESIIKAVINHPDYDGSEPPDDVIEILQHFAEYVRKDLMKEIVNMNKYLDDAYAANIVLLQDQLTLRAKIDELTWECMWNQNSPKYYQPF